MKNKTVRQMRVDIDQALAASRKPVTAQEAAAAILEALVKFDPRPLNFETAEKALALAQFEIKWATLKGGNSDILKITRPERGR